MPGMQAPATNAAPVGDIELTEDEMLILVEGWPVHLAEADLSTVVAQAPLFAAGDDTTQVAAPLLPGCMHQTLMRSTLCGAQGRDIREELPHVDQPSTRCTAEEAR